MTPRPLANDSSLCGGDIYVGSSTVSAAEGRPTADGFEGYISVEIEQKVHGASGMCQVSRRGGLVINLHWAWAPHAHLVMAYVSGGAIDTVKPKATDAAAVHPLVSADRQTVGLSFRTAASCHLARA